MDFTSKEIENAQTSLTNETRKKFNTILKVAMKKSLKESRELVDPHAKTLEIEEIKDVKCPTNSPSVNIIRSKIDNKDSNSFIMNKFLHESNVTNNAYTCNESEVSLKPIPKPRKSRKIESEKLMDCLSNNSLFSQKTYIVENDKNNIETVDELLITCKTPDKEGNESVNSKSGAANITYSLQSSNEQALSIINNSKQNLELVKIDKSNITNSQHDKIIEVIVHKTDKLQLNSYVTHPAVKIHITDIRTGQYYLKSNKNRSVVFYYESEEQAYILPVLTSSCNLQEKRTFCPIWEESILLNEDFSYLANENVIIFFEVLDHVRYLSRNFHDLQKNYCNGWYRIAYAFLKPMGKDHNLNFNKKVRLQLYTEKQIKKQDPHNCDLWDLWKNNKLKKYPSTIYITVKEFVSPKKIIETFRSKTPLQKENISNKILNENKTMTHKVHEKIRPVNISSSTKSFQIPNTFLIQLDSYENGCFLLKFSNNGLYMACAVQMKEDFTVIVYSVESFEEIQYVIKCHGLIYNITWSLDDSLLLAASADNTVAVWNFLTHTFLQVLPHPTYVYACHINSKKTMIVTGCYDTIIRIWMYSEEEKKYELYQEIEKHIGFITSVSFNKKSTNLYSSDSLGYIFEWQELNNYDWSFHRNLSIAELKNTVINQIVLFPNEKKILIHSRDNTLRILSLKRICILYRLEGALNTRVQTFCSISPCGNYVTSGNENGFVIVWNAITGRNVKTYDPFPNISQSQIIHCVQFHPKNNIIAFSHYGNKLPIMLYHYAEEKVMLEENGINQCARTKNITHRSMINRRHKTDCTEILQKIDGMLYKS